MPSIADLGEGVFHFLEFEGFDDCFDFFHELWMMLSASAQPGSGRDAKAPRPGL